MQASKSKLKPLLVIEDSPEDFEVLVRAFNKAEILLPLYRCKDGDDALDFLFKKGRYEGDPYAVSPAIILLDLNLPGTDGYNVLNEIKGHKELGMTPVVVLSTSKSESDVKKSYELGANSYIQKPVDMEGYVRMARMIKSYWFECSILAS